MVDLTTVSAVIGALLGIGSVGAFVSKYAVPLAQKLGAADHLFKDCDQDVQAIEKLIQDAQSGQVPAADLQAALADLKQTVADGKALFS